MRARCRPSRTRWRAPTRPLSARWRAGSFSRSRPWARSASAAVSVRPATGPAGIPRADWPMTADATEPSLLFAPSRGFRTRRTSRPRSRTGAGRYRVGPRDSRWARSGTELAVSSPCRGRSAIQALSCTSAFRPGTRFRCCAFAGSGSKLPPRRPQIGSQCTPVPAIATWVHPAAASRSASSSSSSVIVPDVRTAGPVRPPGPGTGRHATTVSWCTSNPRHRTCTPPTAPSRSASDGSGGVPGRR